MVVENLPSLVTFACASGQNYYLDLKSKASPYVLDFGIHPQGTNLGTRLDNRNSAVHIITYVKVAIGRVNCYFIRSVAYCY